MKKKLKLKLTADEIQAIAADYTEDMSWNDGVCSSTSLRILVESLIREGLIGRSVADQTR